MNVLLKDMFLLVGQIQNLKSSNSKEAAMMPRVKKTKPTDRDSGFLVFLRVTYEAMVQDSGELMGDLVLGGMMPTG